MSAEEDEFTVLISEKWIRQLINDPMMSLADLSASVAFALSRMSPDAWEYLQLVFAEDDGTGTNQCRAEQSAMLTWLRASREWGLMKMAKPIDTDG